MKLLKAVNVEKASKGQLVRPPNKLAKRILAEERNLSLARAIFGFNDDLVSKFCAVNAIAKVAAAGNRDEVTPPV